MKNPILIRGGGDLASGVALRLYRAKYPVIITELPRPLSVRRAVSFSEAIYEGQWKVEDVPAQRADTASQAFDLLTKGIIAVLNDPPAGILNNGQFTALIDARLIKHSYPPLGASAPFTIGLGPGFTAKENCHAAIETNRGHTLGRVYWQGSTCADTGQPEGDSRRVLRAPAAGTLDGYAQIGEHLETGAVIASVNGLPVTAPFPGVLRGLIRPGSQVTPGLKIGDVDPRDQREYCFLASDKALAIGGAVLEALLAHETI